MIDEKLDIKLKLLLGSDLFINENVSISPLTIYEIVSVGYSIYQIYLAIIKDAYDNNYNYSSMFLSENELIYRISASLQFFLKKELDIDFDEEAFIINKTFIKEDEYKQILKNILYQNCLLSVDSEETKEEKKFANDEARKIYEQMQKMKNEVKGTKAKDESEKESDITIYEIISSVSTKSNTINKLNVGQINVFQLYDEFKRIQMIESYDIQIKSIMAGADIKQLEHWSKKTE